MHKRTKSFKYLIKSKYIRSVIFSVIPAFLGFIAIIIIVVLIMFTNEIKNNSINERHQSLELIEKTISQRLFEISSISYNIEHEFYLEASLDNEDTKKEVSESLEKYLVGNDFIKHLAYYRLSEPDVIYTSNEVIDFKLFWTAYLHLSEIEADEYIESIKKVKKIIFREVYLNNDENSYFSYICPLPMLSNEPKAFVLMLIPYNNLINLLEQEMNTYSGKIAIYDNDGREVSSLSNINNSENINLYSMSENEKILINGKKYYVQKIKSEDNGWTFSSLSCLNDAISDSAGNMLLLMFIMIMLLFPPIILFILMIIKKYKPIYQLAIEANDGNEQAFQIINEQNILSSTFSSLKEDKVQREKFETAYYEIEAINKAKSVFFSNMSHDIRTPMNAIIGMTEIAKRYNDDPVKVLECLDNISTSSKYLLEIINNVLDMSRIESGRLILNEEIVNIPKIIYEIETILNSLITQKNLHLIIKTNSLINEDILGDGIRLKQILINIISNAVKFTEKNGLIIVEIREYSNENNENAKYEFIISDNGIGMSKEFLTKIFNTFERDEKNNILQIEGTGLGLAITKSFVELMGGSITCESELNKGSSFTINLPLKKYSSINKKNNDYQSKKAIFVCENIDIYNDVTKLFIEKNIKVTYSQNLNEAINEIEKDAFDFILINVDTYEDIDIKKIKHLSNKIKLERCKLILLIRDPITIEQSVIFDIGIRKTIQTPLFRSTIDEILNETNEGAEKYISDNYEKVDLSGMRVLLVDDNAMNRLIAITLISATGAIVEEAKDGKEAVDIYMNSNLDYFDVILMDLQMPVMNGYEATSVIRSSGRTDSKTIPIFAMTASTFDEEVRKVMKSGMNGHIAKPYSVKQLYEVLCSIWTKEE